MPKVFVLIPAYNAGARVADVIERIPQPYREHVVVVDDGSTDDTAARARSVGDVVVLSHPQNRGYGAAQTTLYEHAREQGADVAVMLHSDGGHRPEELTQVLQPILEEGAEMVIGSRIIGILEGVPARLTWRAFQKGRQSAMPTHVFGANLFLSRVQNRCFRSDFASFHDGYRAVTRAVLDRVPFDRLGTWYLYDTEFLVAAHEAGVDIRQVPVSTFYEPGAAAMSRNVRYGLGILKHALSHRFGRKRPQRRAGG